VPVQSAGELEPIDARSLAHRNDITSTATSQLATPRRPSPLPRLTHFLSVCRQYAVDNAVRGLNGSARCVAAPAKAASPRS
jgi:hypothetical protein